MLPQPLQEWVDEVVNSDDLIWKSGFDTQITMVRDRLPEALAISYEEYRGIRDGMKVVSTHTSKSVTLPVFQFKWSNYTFILRNNFYNWKVTVKWTHEYQNLDDIFGDLIGEGRDTPINSVYCEGFREGDVFGPISEAQDNRGFTVEIANDYKLWTFFWLIKSHVRI